MLPFHPYGLIISLAILSAYLTAYFRRKKYGFSTPDLENLFLFVVPLGIIGARIYHVFDKWEYYLHNTGEIIAVWNGGLGIYGAILGGLFGLFIFLKIYKVDAIASTMTILDFLMPSLAIGQAIGRWGNFFNHEVFGPPTNLPWGWYVPQQFRPDFWQNFSHFHPTFAYESLWVFLGFIVLLILEKSLPDNLLRSTKNFSRSAILSRNRGNLFINFFSLAKANCEKLFGLPANYPAFGKLTAFYAIWYGTGRFFLEFLRFDTAESSGMKIAQIISLVLVVWGGGRLYKIIKN